MVLFESVAGIGIECVSVVCLWKLAFAFACGFNGMFVYCQATCLCNEAATLASGMTPCDGTG